MNKNLLVGIGITLAIVLGLTGIFKKNTVEMYNSKSPVPVFLGGGLAPYADFGGVRHWYAHTDTLNQASTTVCSFKAPVATSTLIFASITLTTGTTTAITVDIAKSNSPSATTTRFASIVLGAGAKGTILASTTSQDLINIVDPPIVFAAALATSTTSTGIPSAEYRLEQFLNFKIGGGNGALNVLTGSCNAEWIQTSPTS